MRIARVLGLDRLLLRQFFFKRAFGFPITCIYAILSDLGGPYARDRILFRKKFNFLFFFVSSETIDKFGVHIAVAYGIE